MDLEDVLRRSKRELRAAHAAVAAMRGATGFESYALGWQTFLDKLEKLWVNAERECQPFRNQFEPWQVAYKELRKNDPLLRYLSQARHADQHSIEPTACETLGAFNLLIPPLGTVEIELDREKGQIRIKGECGIQGPTPPGNMLLPIVNRGTRYDPPTEHLGEKLTDLSPLAVAEKGLAFYEDFLRQAEVRFFPVTA
jgi:hypothetical protein